MSATMTPTSTKTASGEPPRDSAGKYAAEVFWSSVCQGSWNPSVKIRNKDVGTVSRAIDTHQEIVTVGTTSSHATHRGILSSTGARATKSSGTDGTKYRMPVFHCSAANDTELLK